MMVVQRLAFLLFFVLAILTTMKFRPVRLAATDARSWVRTLPGVLSVKYTSELYSLTVVSTATALMWVPYVLARMTTHGVMQAIGNPGPGYPADPP
jgi:hypothetical protein